MSRESFYWLNDQSIEFLKRDYLEHDESPIQRIRNICNYTADLLKENVSDDYFNYMKKGWVSLSSPIWANYGKKRGLGISCFSVDIQDDTSDILRAGAEIGMMSKYGGGTAGYFGKLRSRGESISGGGKSNGVVSFLDIFESISNTISQNAIRRGSFAAYLPIDHKDIEEFLTIRSTDSTIQKMSFGVTITNDWMNQMINGDSDKRKIWAKVLQKRSETGYPYLFFKDNANNNKPDVYKDYEINHSNLCTEIMLPTNNDISFVCCLLSVNLEHYDEWKNDNKFILRMMNLLDCVLDDFIMKADKIPFFEKAVKFAKEHRAVGLGVLGLHSYFQKNEIPFEGLQAKYKITEIFKHLKIKTEEASELIARVKGEPVILKGYKKRFTTNMSIAPTTSSSFILGQVSPSIEPLNSNYFLKDVAKGRYAFKNPYLEKLLIKKDKNNSEVWNSILENNGSVKHLDFLDDNEKMVFKTFDEISQLEIIQNASIMQKYVDQGISLNLKIHPDTPVKDINNITIEAWKLGLKSLYYQRSTNKAQELSRDLLQCVSCEA